MTTLTDFLLARIAEDEAWVERERLYLGGDEPWALFEAGDGLTGGIGIDPRRLAAECEAKRRIVELALATEGSAGRMADMPTLYALEEGRASLGQEMCRALALPYADHPDYREEWRP